MIRSAPPASASFAERPVPAPAPMIGLPASTWARSRASASFACHRISSCRRSAIATANAGSLMSRLDLVHLDRVVERLAQPREERSVRVGVVEHLPLDGDHRDALQRHEQHRRALGVGQLAADRPSELGALLGRRAHQRHRRVVHVEIARLELRRHGLARAEVHHVERAERHDLRHARCARRLQPVGACGEHAADELVRELRRRRVEHAGEEPVAHERLERLSACARRVEHEHLVAELLETLARARHARRRDAEHRRSRRAASPRASAPSRRPSRRSHPRRSP